MTEPRVYLILKNGVWYRPNSAGYTSHVSEAGRYTLSEAEAITHPNGRGGPRDGMSFVHQDKVARPVQQVEPVAWASDEALRRLSRGSPTAIDALRDGDAVHPLYLAPPSREAELREALEALVEYVEAGECVHESTHRGGAIWTICDDCGRQWADDEGGFVPYREPEALTNARRAISHAHGDTK